MIFFSSLVPFFFFFSIASYLDLTGKISVNLIQAKVIEETSIKEVSPCNGAIDKLVGHFPN